MTMHFTEDSTQHDGYTSPFGHALEIIFGSNPDLMSADLASKTLSNTIRVFEAVTGVSTDTVLPGDTSSIRDRATANLNEALQRAGEDGASGAQFERQFNGAARDLLPDDALRLPTLPGLSPGMLLRSTYSQALGTTADYLNSIGLDADPSKFLSDAANAYVTIANTYLEKTGGVLSNGTQVSPIDVQHLFRAPSADAGSGLPILWFWYVRMRATRQTCDLTTKRGAAARKALLRPARALGLALAMLAAGASAINIPEGTSKLQLATEIDRAYVAPLGLKGKPAVRAIDTLLAEGFRCNLQHGSPIGLDEPPLSLCVKQPSGFGSYVTACFSP